MVMTLYFENVLTKKEREKILEKNHKHIDEREKNDIKQLNKINSTAPHNKWDTISTCSIHKEHDISFTTHLFSTSDCLTTTHHANIVK